MLSRQTLYFAGSNTCTFDVTELGFGLMPTNIASHVVSREEGYLMILKECETGTSSAECVLIEARAQHGQVQDTECQSFFLNSRGRQSALDDNGNDSTEACWK